MSVLFLDIKEEYLKRYLIRLTLILDAILDALYYVVSIALIGIVNLVGRYIGQLTGLKGLENSYVMRFIENIEYLLIVCAILSLAISTITRLIDDFIYPSYSSILKYKVLKVPLEEESGNLKDTQPEQQTSNMKTGTKKQINKRK